MCIYLNENCVLVTHFKTWGFLEHFLMESGNANIFRLSFTKENLHFKQTNILSKNAIKITKSLTEETMPVIFARFLSRVTDFI